jgi:capsular exopolysaccharide synthesis family protein
MSRIHEALRRAAEERAETSADALDASTPEPVDGDSVSALAREPFPVEIGQRRKVTPTIVDGTVFTTTEPPVAEPAPPPPPATPATDPDDESPLGIFSRLDGRLAEKVVADDKMSPISREQYRRVAGVLLDAQGNNGLRVVMVASAVPGEGKTLTASNLALTLSESYRRRVLLIDADLRRPAVHEVFRLNAATGLIDGLDGGKHGKLVLRQVSPNLAVLPAGRPTTDPMAALTSPRMGQLLAEAKEAFDFVIIDTPPLMLLPDAHLLSSLIDGAVLVVKARSTPHAAVKRTAEVIGRDRIVGVVLNQAESQDQSHYGKHDHYGKYYGSHYLASKGGSEPR